MAENDKGRRTNSSWWQKFDRTFQKAASWASWAAGTSWATLFALTIIVCWAVTGPIFNYSDTWQLVINTGTTIVTFLMVFLIQNSQNRDSKAIQIKLDELLRGTEKTRNQFIEINELSDAELDRLQKQFRRLRSKCDQVEGKLEVEEEVLDAEREKVGEEREELSKSAGRNGRD